MLVIAVWHNNSNGLDVIDTDIDLIIRQFGISAYHEIYQSMRCFANARGLHSVDEIWWLQHYPIYTLGISGGMHHIIAPGALPVLKTDRGGQVTYHGPGQLIIYPLIDLRRRALNVRGYVTALEQAVIDFLALHHIQATRKKGAPGVYVDAEKIAALGVRIRRHCSYHGLSLNVDLDLKPYQRINPCGYPDQRMTSLKRLGLTLSVTAAFQGLQPFLLRHLNYPDDIKVHYCTADAETDQIALQNG